MFSSPNYGQNPVLSSLIPKKVLVQTGYLLWQNEVFSKDYPMLLGSEFLTASNAMYFPKFLLIAYDNIIYCCIYVIV